MSAEAERPTWTGRLRTWAVALLPPEKLLPDTQPIYVASWVYVFGVLSLSAFVLVLFSGAVLALAGPSWWHRSATGHFFNSMHFWSTELFFFLMVVHLWGKFFMAAWRGRRALTWITGALTFLVSIAAAFTGYLSQQNFDSQWIGTQAKDGLNASGVGAFFNTLDFGQMFAWHVLLLPFAVALLIGGHILLVRSRGVSPPLPARSSGTPEDPNYPRAPDPAVEWTGGKRRYDLIKELTIALGAITLLTLLLSALFSSPDVKPVTIASWASTQPQDFATTALSELDGTSGVAAYGPPYTHVQGAGQNIVDGISLERAVGVRIPIDPGTAFVLDPLSVPAQRDPKLAAAITRYRSASPAQQQKWTAAYGTALMHAQFANGTITLPTAPYGPVGTLMSGLLEQAQSGGLDGALVSNSHFFQTDYTKPLLFLADGGYLASLAQQQNLLGRQWGMMNETGNYPGQAWLWLYTFWYQIPPFNTSSNADAQIWAIMAILSVALIFVPFIPGIRSLPRFLPVYRAIWRDYYRGASGLRLEPRPTDQP